MTHIALRPMAMVLALATVAGPAMAAPEIRNGRGEASQFLEGASVADLVIERRGNDVLALARNLLGGPVEMELRAVELHGTVTDPALPLRRVVPAGQSVVLAKLTLLTADARYDLRLDGVPGEPNAVAQDFVYSLPVEESQWQMGQGFHGEFSHSDEQNRYAIDLIVPEGTPVLAARAGVVLLAESGFGGGGTDRRLYVNRANAVRVLHDDGSIALYNHLQEGGVLVHTGDRVSMGQLIGRAGSTGFTSGPHLHFAVQVNVGMRLVSIPFRMVGPDGFLPLQAD